MSDERTGRAIDAAVAEKIMAWTEIVTWEGGACFGIHPGRHVVLDVPYYSRDWAGAGVVIEEMRRKGWAVRINDVGAYGWDVTFNGHGRTVFGNAPEIGVAVCWAALNTIEGTT